jgi:hypothetical protein
MKKLFFIPLLFCGLWANAQNCIPCVDNVAQGAIENADLSIKSLSLKNFTPSGYTIRVDVAYINDDCAKKPKLVVLMPSNAIPTVISGILTSNPATVTCSVLGNGSVECKLGAIICPTDSATIKNPWVEIKVKSKIQNVSAFVYSATPDARQCNNFKHFSN